MGVLELCEDLFKHMTNTKCFSVQDKMLTACAAMNSLFDMKLSLSEMKRKLKYFVHIVEENLLICEGTDNPETTNKKVLKAGKFMLQNIETMKNESEYQIFMSNSNTLRCN